MKQRLYLFMALMAAIISLGACSSDGNDEEGEATGVNIVGTWYRESEGYGDEVQFMANGTVNMVTTMLNAPTSKVRDSGTYQLKGSTLTIRWTKTETWNNMLQTWTTDDESTETVVLRVSVEGATLYVYSTDKNESKAPMVFTRK